MKRSDTEVFSVNQFFPGHFQTLSEVEYKENESCEKKITMEIMLLIKCDKNKEVKNSEYLEV